MALQLTSVNTQMRESHSLLDKMATTLGNTVKWNVSSAAVNALARAVG
ncbi:MAG: hypothetical protein VZR33_03600 [Methanosphaera sp.]|nr:hypothetical protein [Methanosphaera sp.]